MNTTKPHRVLTYSRFSSDQQRDASIEDQQRLCHEFADANGWVVVGDYVDPALSGASMVTRPGIQALLAAATRGDCNVVLAESLDRFSRDQADSASFFKKLNFLSVQIVTLAEGEIGHLHIGLKGTMNALYLVDLAQKTRRGLRGRVEAGRSGGGCSYGYRVTRPAGENDRGILEIDESQAEVIRRIFRDYLRDRSPERIAKALNAEGVPGPRGAAWSASTIYGNHSRGTGILNNELYVGRRVWGRQRFVKDPDTGKRVARLNPVSEWTNSEVPHLRIIDDDTWKRVKERQTTTRRATGGRPERARRPLYLFSRLTKCAVCGGGFILSSHGRLICFNAHDRGTCTNRHTIKRTDVEARVLSGLRHRMLEPEAFAEFCAGFSEEMRKVRREHVARVAVANREVAKLDRRSKQIMELLLNGYRDEAWKRELHDIDRRRTELRGLIAAAESEVSFPEIHPRMAEVFRERVTSLAAALGNESGAADARLQLRALVQQVLIPGDDGPLKLVGNAQNVLTAAAGVEALAAVGNDGCGGRI